MATCDDVQVLNLEEKEREKQNSMEIKANV
jgi:hypothetical protein